MKKRTSRAARCAALTLALVMLTIPVLAAPLESVLSKDNLRANVVYSFNNGLYSNDTMGVVAKFYHENDPLVFYALDWRWNSLTYYVSAADGPITGISFPASYLEKINDEGYAAWITCFVDDVIASSGISDTDTDAEKVKKLAYYVAYNFVYDYDASMAFYDEGYGFLETMYSKGITFCMTDAMLMTACCDRLEIPCLYIEGETSERHAWNKVYIDGEWTEVDVTFVRKASDPDAYIFFDSGREILFEA